MRAYFINRKWVPIALMIIFSGCAGTGGFLGVRRLNVPPEFNQPVLLEVSDSYQLYQANRSGYDVGDLQSFHAQHNFPNLIEGAFLEMFPSVRVAENVKQNIQLKPGEQPPIFEVRVLDVGHDLYMDSADSYRAKATIAMAMKDINGKILWQKAVRGDGYAKVDPQFSTGLGPQDAIVDAIDKAITQMQEEMINSVEVRTYLLQAQERAEAIRQLQIGGSEVKDDVKGTAEEKKDSGV